jgi:hypothetical protein
MVGLMQKHNGCLGGAIWSGIDDTFRLPEGAFIGYGPWGPIDSLRRMKPEFWHVRKAYSPVRLLDATKALKLSRTVKLKVENRLDFSNLSQVVATATVRNTKIPLKLRGGPRTTNEIALTLPFDPSPGEEMAISFILPERWGYPSRPEKDVFLDNEVLHFEGALGPAVRQEAEAPVFVEETSTKIVVKSGLASFSVDRESGALTDATLGKQQVAIAGPTLMVLPLNSDSGGSGGNDYRLGIEPFNPTCANWKVKSVSVEKTTGQVKIAGSYDEADGFFTLSLVGDKLTVNYAFKMLKEVNPRQSGIVMDFSRSAFQSMSWKRRGYWSCYPNSHIGRNEGWTAIETDPANNLRGTWSLDTTSMGSNDLRSTKSNALETWLNSPNGWSIVLTGDAPFHTRAWLEGTQIRMLMAGFNTGGSDAFFAAHYFAERRPLKVGDEVKGQAIIELRTTPQE